MDFGKEPILTSLIDVVRPTGTSFYVFAYFVDLAELWKEFYKVDLKSSSIRSLFKKIRWICEMRFCPNFHSKSTSPTSQIKHGKPIEHKLAHRKSICRCVLCKSIFQRTSPSILPGTVDESLEF